MLQFAFQKEAEILRKCSEVNGNINVMAASSAPVCTRCFSILLEVESQRRPWQDRSSLFGLHFNVNPCHPGVHQHTHFTFWPSCVGQERNGAHVRRIMKVDLIIYQCLLHNIEVEMNKYFDFHYFYPAMMAALVTAAWFKRWSLVPPDDASRNKIES